HEDWRKAVHRDQRRPPPSLPPPVKLSFDPLVVRLEYRAHACGFLVSAEADVSPYDCELTDFRNRRLRARHAIAVDDETRIILLYQGGVECVCHEAANGGDTDVPRDVAFAFCCRDTKAPERTRHV